MTEPAKKQSSSQLVTACLAILAAVALGVALYFMRPVLVPLVLAVMVAYLVVPVVDFVQVKLRMPRAAAVVAALLLAAGALTLVVMMITSSAKSLAAKAPLYQDKVVQLGQSGLDFAQRLGLPVDSAAVKSQLGDLPVAGILGGALNSLVDWSSTFFLVLIFVIYLVSGQKPGHHRKGVYREIDSTIRRYLAVKVYLSAATGIAVGLILWIIGLDLAAVFGVLAFLLNFIPSIGSVIATLLPLPLAIVQFDSTAAIILAVVLPGAIQMGVGNALEPKMMGKSLNLHPITILLSLIFWGMLWGLPGMVLAAPITAVVKIVLDRVDATRPVGALLGGQLPGQ